MSVSFTCPGCGKHYTVRDELAGKRVKCKCGENLHIPSSLDEHAAGPAQSPPAAPDGPPGAEPAGRTSFQCTECGQQYTVRGTLAGKQARCKCGAVVQVPAAPVAAPDPSLGSFLDEALAEPSPADLLSGELPATVGPTLTAAAPLPVQRQRARVKIELGSGNALRLVALVLIAIDAVQSGIWMVPSLLDADVLKSLFTSFWGWATLASLGAHVGLIVGGIGIIGGQEFGRNCAGISAVVLLGVVGVNVLMVLPNIGTLFRFIGIAGFLGLLIRTTAIPLSIAYCVFHPAWEE